MTSEIKFASRRSFTAFSTASDFLGDCLLRRWATALTPGSTVNWWQATLGSIPGMSIALHANRSAFFLRLAISCALTSLGRSLPILKFIEGSFPKGTSSNSLSGIGLRSFALSRSFFSLFCSLRSSLVNLRSSSTKFVSRVLAASFPLSSAGLMDWGTEFWAWLAWRKHLLAASMSPLREALIPSFAWYFNFRWAVELAAPSWVSPVLPIMQL